MPHDPDAERAVLGSMLLTRAARDAVLGSDLTASDFHDPALGRVYAAIVAVHHAGAAPDVPAVLAALAPEDEHRGSRPGADKALLARLAGEAPASMNAAHHARRVAELAACRRAIAVAFDLGERAHEGDLDALGAVLDSAPEMIARPLAGVATAPDLADLLASDDPPEHPWIVPGLLRINDRLVLSGGEGHGKSSLLRQLIVSVACGVHPLTGLPCARKRGLIIDLQEDEHDLRRELGKLARGYQAGWLHVVARPQGMNLLSTVDQRWLEALIAHHRPEFVIVGPLYKLYRATERLTTWAEETVEHVTRVWDDLRVRYQFALAIEGHAGHDRDTWRIRGSSAWYAWPDFGLGLDPQPNDLRREVLVKHWRGDRHPGRPWPRRLYGGQEQQRPWIPDERSYEQLVAVDAADGLVEQPGLGDAF